MDKIMYENAYKGIIFDLDGTLVDTIEDLIDAVNEVMADFGYPSRTYEEGRKFIGKGVRILLRRALPDTVEKTEELLDKATEKMLTAYAKRYTNKSKPYTGIKDLLRYFHIHKIPIAICTNKPDAPAKIIVEALFETEKFAAVVGQKEGFPRKPDPTTVLGVCAEMGLKPSECIYMGDSEVDYETAKNAGMMPLLCLWGYGKEEVLKSHDDALWIKSPMRAIAAVKYGMQMYEIFNEKKENE